MYTAMRNRWLALDTANAQRLFRRHQRYPLLVTEQGHHELDFEVMTQNEGFVVYSQDGEMAPRS